MDISAVKFLRQSDIGKQLDKFDKLPIAIQLEKFLSSDPACIKLFQFLVKRHGYVFNEEVVEYFRKEYSNLSSIPSFVIQRRCKRCNLSFEYISMADIDFDKTKYTTHSPCPNCRSSIYIEETEYKKFQISDIISIFLYGMRCGIFKPFQYSICPFCKYEERLNLNESKNHIKTDCRKCEKPIEIKVLFEVDDIILDYLEIVESQGYWFDWYLGYMIKNMKDRIVKRNQIYRVGEREIEIDIIVEKNESVIGISCSTERTGKFDSEDFHLIKDICNRLILACPDNKVPTKIVDCAKSIFNENIATIELKNFCHMELTTYV